jgi:haloacetate dehalogenase
MGTRRLVIRGPGPEGRVRSVFDGFTEFDIEVAETTIHGRRGGSGPPLLLLHGMPETHLMWHRLAPRLAQDFTVVATDLRGCGDSGKPASAPDHAPYAMRALARDQVEVMTALGFGAFAVCGHDRGARCAYRLALDSPRAVTRLAVLDIVPTGDAFGRADKDFALGFWLWTFLAAPQDVPERLLGCDPEALLDYALDAWAEEPDAFPAEVRAEYARALHDPATVHAICEEYRAAATLDCEHDEADRGRRKISCPVLALWARDGALDNWYDPLEVWRAWADDVRGGPVRSGHFLPEEAPDETYGQLHAFLAAPADP